MFTTTDKFLENGCDIQREQKLCRTRGGESCALDGAMIVLQPIADTAHIIHGPIACCGNSWEGRGTLSSKGNLYKMGFTTDMNVMDIVYGSEEKLLNAIKQTNKAVKPEAIFVYSTCVSGLIGEDIESVCKKAEKELGKRVIPVNAPGFVGPKNLGNRIAGKVLLDYVIGTGKASDPPYLPLPEGGEGGIINLIGEYNIAGDLWLVEPLLREAGIRILSRITGDSTFEEITYAHMAKLNVVICSRALINVAKEMERKYGIPYIEVSFFGKTETTKALRKIIEGFSRSNRWNRWNGWNNFNMIQKVEKIIVREEKWLAEKLRKYDHLKGKKAVLYTGGVKSWSFISALLDLGIEIVAVGTKKSTFEDENKMKEILGDNAPLVEDVSPANLYRFMKEKEADILIAGGRNLYLAMKEGFPFVDVNQERHIAYAGYNGLVNLAEQISNSIRFFERSKHWKSGIDRQTPLSPEPEIQDRSVLINPLKHSRSIGAVIALQGIHKALPIIHGAQGCSFLAKVLITKHYREPIALISTKLFTEDVVMGSDENIVNTIKKAMEKQSPDVIGVLTTGLSEVRGDDVADVIKRFKIQYSKSYLFHIPTPDYEGGMEEGYARAVKAALDTIAGQHCTVHPTRSRRIKQKRQINLLVGSHLTPADFTELRRIIESFDLRPIIFPDLSALDGSRQGFSALALGGTEVSEIETMNSSEFTIAIGMSMEGPARILKERFDIDYSVFESISGLRGTDAFMKMLSILSGRSIPAEYERQRRILVDGMRDVHFYYGGKKVCLALEPDLSIQISKILDEMGADIELVILPYHPASAQRICARNIVIGDLFSIKEKFDLLISNSHAEDIAERFNIPLYQMGFPVYKTLGYTSKITIGYRGALTMINEMANLMM
jgi:nitrogenase molybdenum-cofactor synthesis protein NifE